MKGDVIFLAKANQKFGKYSHELKMEIVNKYLSGKGDYKSLSEEYNVPYFTVNGWITKYKNGNDLKDRHCFSGKKKDNDIDYKERYEILKKYQAFLKAQRDRK